MSKKNYKHLSKNDREMIEEGLNVKMSVSAIAKSIGVSPATITREILRNRRDDGYSKSTWNTNNRCAKRRSCNIHHLCASCSKKCSACKADKCNRICKEYIEDICIKIAKAPHVCNGCTSYSACRLHKYRYSAHNAQTLADARAKESREGIDVSPEDMKLAADLIRPLLAKGQSPSLIWNEHWQKLPFSQRSLYRHIHGGSINIIALELPKAVKYRPRTHKKLRTKPIPYEAMIGHLYEDFLALDENVRTKVVECDCMEGPADTNDAILTLHFKALHFQIGIKLEVKDTAHVVAAINWLHEILGDAFSDYFWILLCDRGCEFKDIKGMEYAGDKKRCAVYFTNAQRPDQKGSCEKNHVEIRKIIPKGTSLALIDAYVLAEVFSHANSSARESLYWMVPMELAMKALPKVLFDELGYRLIDPDDVTLKPSLLDKAIKTKG